MAYNVLMGTLNHTHSLTRKIRWKGGIRATEIPLYFGGNPDHVTLARVTTRSGHGIAWEEMVTRRRLFNSNSFATSAALAEV